MQPRSTGARSRLLRPCFLVGGLVGLGLAVVAVTWLLVANREPSLEYLAVDRNLAVCAVAGLLMLVPVFFFLKSPARIFISGLLSWSILSITYLAMTGHFQNLEARLGVFHLFMLGALAFALAAVFVWILQIMLMGRHQPLIATRRR